MTKVKGPLFSLEAHGELNDCLIYQKISTGYIVKGSRYLQYSRTPAQDAVRDIFSFAVSTWINLHASKQLQWMQWVNYTKLIGYASFMNYFLKRTYLHLWQFEVPPNTGFCLVGNHNVGEFIVGGGYMTPD